MTDGFTDREDAGRQLAGLLGDYRGRDDVVVAALPRGGVVVGAAVAEALGAPLDVVVVRKVSVPRHDEVAMGALAVWGKHTEVVRNADVIRQAGVDDAAFDTVCQRELDEARRRIAAWEVRPVPLAGRTVLLVDDGAATGATVRAAVAAVRRGNPEAVVVALPVASPSAYADLSAAADVIRCVRTPRRFGSVGAAYADFDQVADEDVGRALAAARSTRPAT